MPATDETPPSRRWKVPALLFAVVAVVYAATISTAPSFDVYAADFAAWHIAETGDPVPEMADFPALDDNIIRETWIVRTADGREAVGRAPGTIAATVPAYLLADSDHLTAVPGGVAAALLTAASVTLLFLLLRDRTGARAALVAAAVFGLATPVWSVAANGMWPHTITVFAILGMAWAADRDRWWLVGLFGGVALWGRLHAAVICAVLGVVVAVVRRRPLLAVRVGVVSGALLALMSVWTHWMYGSWDPSSGYRAGDFTGNADDNLVNLPNFLGFWVAPDRGLLVWTPLLLVLLPALVRGWRELPDWSRALVGAGVVYLLVQGLLVRFSGGDAFYGYRTSLELLACATPALALSAEHMGATARRLFAPVALLQLAMIAPGAVHEDLGLLVADVWHKNSFWWQLFERPGAVVPVAAGALAVGSAFAYVVLSGQDGPRGERGSGGMAGRRAVRGRRGPQDLRRRA
ncbi:MAG TPA: hypothetical protein VNS55_03485 [Nocardioides sp.]|nr:hypothetical protein [Nocardioides sp.]